MKHDTTLLDIYKGNVLELAKEHKRVCNGVDCEISLILLRAMAEELGIKFTKEEEAKFI